MRLYGYISFFCWVLLATGYGVNDFIYFDILRPSQLAYLYKVLPAKDFGGLFNIKYNNVALVLSEPLDSCSPLDKSYEGQFVLASRGSCAFIRKALHAQQARALGLMVYNHDLNHADLFISMLHDKEYDHVITDITIPTAFMRGSDGHSITELLQQLNLDRVMITIPVNVTGTDRTLWSNAPWNLI
ncbi:protease-associated domain-containing protein 1-like [Dysidea avara]|uniref:protease-associated domain-containing protein 1-like n=1 Tax=Dysidea avara TaxID=196820 RepID=UPI0033201302